MAETLTGTKFADTRDKPRWQTTPREVDARSDGFDVRESRHHPGRWEHRLTRDGGRPMPRMSKNELFAAIRRDLAAGMSGRTIEERYRVGRGDGERGHGVGVAATTQNDAATGIQARPLQARDR